MKTEQVVASLCGDGKIRLREINYFDCENYKYHSEPYIWAECIKYSVKYYSECIHQKDFKDCEYFKLNKKIQEKLS